MKQLHRIVLRLCLIFPGPMISYGQTNANSMETKMNDLVLNEKEIILQLYEEALNRRRLDLIPTLVSKEYTSSSGAKGLEGFMAGVEAVLRALPDAHWQIEDLIAEKGRVVIRWTLAGTHTGMFQSVKPTGKKILNEGMAIYELKDGKIMGHRVLNDRLGFQQSLGVLPQDLSALQRKANVGHPAVFIDKFFVPADAENEFVTRMKINRDLIRTFPGFIEDNVYRHRDQHGNLIYITVAVWEDQAAIEKARERVQAEYQRNGFDLKEMTDRLGIKMERGVYEDVNRTKQ